MQHLTAHWQRLASANVYFLEYPDEIVLMVDNQRAGQISWTLEQDRRVFGDDWEQALGDSNGYYLRVKALVVYPEYRRQGYGTMLFDRFKQEAQRFGPKGWDPGAFTPDGKKFWKGYTGEDVRATERMIYGQPR